VALAFQAFFSYKIASLAMATAPQLQLKATRHFDLKFFLSTLTNSLSSYCSELQFCDPARASDAIKRPARAFAGR